MMWKAIGESVTGTSHLSGNRLCEDAVRHNIYTDATGAEVLVCIASDGAGSAQYAAYSSTFAVETANEFVRLLVASNETITEGHIFAMAEDIYDGLEQRAASNEIELNEFSCTLLGCILTPTKSVFFQIGDGAIVRDDANGNYCTIWWPQNGEYHNSTSFLVDDRNFANLQVVIVEEPINEVAIFTDGLQQLALNSESRSVHQPFFTNLFRYLRLADDTNKLAVLKRKLAEYLDSPTINGRTDDDKTLFLATRLTS